MAIGLFWSASRRASSSPAGTPPSLVIPSAYLPCSQDYDGSEAALVRRSVRANDVQDVCEDLQEGGCTLADVLATLAREL